jgi:hypothetical protein
MTEAERPDRCPGCGGEITREADGTEHWWHRENCPRLAAIDEWIEQEKERREQWAD